MPAKDIASVIANEPSTIKEYVEAFGENVVSVMLFGGLQDLLKFINVQQGMIPEQVYQTATLIISEYSRMPLAAIKLFFKEVKLGKYKIYNKIDGTDILAWLHDYYKEHWKEYVLDRDYVAEDGSNAKKIEVVDIGADENVQRFINKMRGKGCFTDAELNQTGNTELSDEEKARLERAKSIRIEVLRETSHYYSEMTPQEAEKKIKEAIHKALVKENLEKYETIK